MGWPTEIALSIGHHQIETDRRVTGMALPLIIASFMLLLMVLGGLPTRGQDFMEEIFEWWPDRAMALVSEFLEFFFGVGMVRYAILRKGFGQFSEGHAVAWFVVGAFFGLEGLFRLIANSAIKDRGVPSLVLWAVFFVGSRVKERVTPGR